jgi:hypothetical protein
VYLTRDDRGAAGVAVQESSERDRRAGADPSLVSCGHLVRGRLYVSLTWETSSLLVTRVWVCPCPLLSRFLSAGFHTGGPVRALVASRALYALDGYREIVVDLRWGAVAFMARDRRRRPVQRAG